MQAHHYPGALVEARGANYHFTAKENQSGLHEPIAFYFQSNPNVADFTQTGNGEHGRIETRKIRVTTKLNHYLNFPPVCQAFMVERKSIDKKSGKISQETAYGIASAPTDQTSPEQILADNRGHWRVESCHYIIDWNYD